MLFDYQNTFSRCAMASPQSPSCRLAPRNKKATICPSGHPRWSSKQSRDKSPRGLTSPPVLLPVMPFGTSGSHLGSAGTISLGWSTLMDVITDLVESLALQGISRMVVIDSLGGAMGGMTRPQENFIVKTAVRQMNYDHPEIDVLWVQPFTAAAPS